MTQSMPLQWQSLPEVDKQRVLRRLRLEQARQMFRTPGQLATWLDARTVKTPALDILDAALVRASVGMLGGSTGRRLLFSMAPQEGKSVRTSRVYPLWLLIHDPNRRIAIVSYADALAIRWGREIRDLIKQHPELGLIIDQSTGAAKEWKLGDGYDGGVITTGIQAGLTGRAVDVLIIDDPIKDSEQADSENWRRMCKGWWQTTASSRLPGVAVVVVIMTRWHDDDLSGWLAKEYPESWHVVNLPAQADHNPEEGETDILGREPGEYMLSARGRSTENWDQRKRDAGPRAWNALYQGRPSPAEGGVFQKGWWRFWEAPYLADQEDGTTSILGMDQVWTSWDMAFKDTKSSDYVVGQLWGRRGTNAYLLHQVRGRWDFPTTLVEFVSMVVRFPQVNAHLVEDKANGPAVIASIREKVAGVIAITPTESKLARANAVTPFVAAGDVHLPPILSNPHTQALIDEAASFPFGAHDDYVDALTQALSWVSLANHSIASSYLDRLLKDTEDRAALPEKPATVGIVPPAPTEDVQHGAKRWDPTGGHQGSAVAPPPPLDDDDVVESSPDAPTAVWVVSGPPRAKGVLDAIMRRVRPAAGSPIISDTDQEQG